MGVDVRRPKPIDTQPGDEIVGWAREQLGIARAILDNPGGGLLFATQAIGQVKSGLHERDADRWRKLVGLLEEAEDAAIHRRFGQARDRIEAAVAALG
jgi:hypothetical protein